MITIIVDSTADFSTGELEELKLLRAPLTLHWDGKEYRDGVDITPPEFYERLRNSASLPTTSQVPAPVFGDLFRQALERGDEVIAMTLSHRLSGTYQSATIARDELSDEEAGRVWLLDTGTASLGFMILAREAVRMRDEGCDAKRIVEVLEQLRQRLYIYACVDTLKYLHKGGRLSGSAAVMGTLLSVKPVLCIRDGLISVEHKVRGSAAAHDWVAKAVKKLGIDRSYPIIVGSTQCPEQEQNFTRSLHDLADIEPSDYCEIGSVIGTHAGPGAVAVAFIAG